MDNAIKERERKSSIPDFGNDINLDDLDKNDKKFSFTLFKKVIKILVLIIFLIVIISLIIFLLSNKVERGKNKSRKNEICEPGYKLLDGKCLINYSFKALYYTENDNETINLIYNFPNGIKEIIADDNDIIPCHNYTFPNSGNHTVYMLLNMTKCDSLHLMFFGNKRLISISFSEIFNTENITNLRNMFDGCKSLISIDFSNFNTKNVVNMNKMFHECSSLTSINISNFDTQSVTGMYNLFYGCSSLTSLNLSNFDTKNVKDMYGMFQFCKSLTSIDLSYFNTSSLNYMDYMFHFCPSLRYIDLSTFNVLKYDSLFTLFLDLPDTGVIKIKKKIYDKLNDEIPPDWNVTIT